MDPRSKLISPELALVDGELSRAALPHLPEPEDVPTPRPPAPHHRGGIRTIVTAPPSLLALVAGLLVAGLIGTPSRGWLPFGRTAHDPATSGQAANPRVSELRWRPVRDAAFYDLVLLRAGARAVGLRVTTNHIRPPTLIAKAGRRLAPGIYTWYVRAAVANEGRARLGNVLAVGVLSVPA